LRCQTVTTHLPDKMATATIPYMELSPYLYTQCYREQPRQLGFENN